MSFAPNGSLYLIKNVPLDNSYENTIDFTTKTEQETYFLSKEKITLNEYTYIRQDEAIKVSLNIESLYYYDYVMYRNYATGKWIFSFITSKVYLNEGTTKLLIETDVMQTFQFEHTLETSFVEREHQNRWSGLGSPIYNIVPENLTLGDEYVKEAEQTVYSSPQNYIIVSTAPLGLHPVNDSPNMVQQYPTPFYYYLLPSGSAQTFCKVLADNPAIVNVSLIPVSTFGIGDCSPITYMLTEATSITLYRITGNVPSKITVGYPNKFTGASMPSSLGVGNSRNYKYESKLLTYPYSYNVLTDYQSPHPLILKNEYINGSDLTIEATQSIGHQVKTKYYVASGYKGETNGKENCLINNTVNDLPLISDAYKNYMLQNKAQATTGMALSVASAVGGIALGAFTGGLGAIAGAGNLMSSFSKISMELAKRKDLQNIPDSVRYQGNNIAFDIADGNMSLKFIRLAVDNKIKKLLGDYFAMYGYKCCEVKKPDLRSRYYYNFIKTVGANIDSNIDMKYVKKLISIYDNGITIWHNRTGVTPLNYTYDNVEMSFA